MPPRCCLAKAVTYRSDTTRSVQQHTLRVTGYKRKRLPCGVAFVDEERSAVCNDLSLDAAPARGLIDCLCGDISQSSRTVHGEECRLLGSPRARRRTNSPVCFLLLLLLVFLGKLSTIFVIRGHLEARICLQRTSALGIDHFRWVQPSRAQ